MKVSRHLSASISKGPSCVTGPFAFVAGPGRSVCVNFLNIRVSRAVPHSVVNIPVVSATHLNFVNIRGAQ